MATVRIGQEAVSVIDGFVDSAGNATTFDVQDFPPTGAADDPSLCDVIVTPADDRKSIEVISRAKGPEGSTDTVVTIEVDQDAGETKTLEIRIPNTYTAGDAAGANVNTVVRDIPTP